MEIGHREYCFLVILGLFVLVGMAIPRHLTVTKTDSVRYHVFWEKEGWRPSRGNYVRLNLTAPKMGCDPCSIVKRIGCMPGEWLVGKDGRFFCNGHYLGQARKGNHPHFVFDGTVPQGSVFLIGDKENSYDSRYFGLKPLADIETVLRPLF